MTPLALEEKIASECELISRKSRAGTYKFTAYRQLLVSKGAGRPPRVISIPTARDRLVLKSLSFLIESVFPESRGKVAQKKVLELRNVIESQCFDTFVRVDVKDFYPSVSHDALFEVLKTRIRKPEILSLLAGAIQAPTLADHAPRSEMQNRCGVPQGLSVSNFLAEIAMKSVDAKFSARSDLAYIRYVDDIIILCAAEDAEHIFDNVLLECKAISLEVHELKKSGSKSSLGPLSDSFDYLGYVFDTSKVSVRAESVNKVKSSLARVFTRYKYEILANANDPGFAAKARSECLWKLNLVITGCIFDGQRRGWLHYFSQIDDISVLKELDSSVRNFAKRFGLDLNFSPKTFVRAYWKINKDDDGANAYIPNLDTLTGDQKRKILADVFHKQDALTFSDQFTDQVFYREVKRLVDTLEHDISGFS